MIERRNNNFKLVDCKIFTEKLLKMDSRVPSDYEQLKFSDISTKDFK